jgi:2-C-methyl-D-erythritol 4-phosphate cytidylyltransferase
MVEWLGEPVVIVPDDPANLKVTTAFDLEVAELLATRKSPGQGG